MGCLLPRTSENYSYEYFIDGTSANRVSRKLAGIFPHHFRFTSVRMLRLISTKKEGGPRVRERSRGKSQHQERRHPLLLIGNPKKEGSFATRESRTRAISFERLPKKETRVLHAYGVALSGRKKGEQLIADKKRPEARESPQTVERKAEGWRLYLQQERGSEGYRGRGGAGSSDVDGPGDRPGDCTRWWRGRVGRRLSLYLAFILLHRIATSS
jgi:hypothetical protein